MSAPLVEVSDLRKSFRRPGIRSFLRRTVPEAPVLRGITLDVQPGDSVALLGANGAGKTTVLKSIATLLLPDSGLIRVLGTDVARDPGSARRHVGYVLADDRSFHWRLTASENLDFFARLEGISAGEAKPRIAALLERLDLQANASQPFGEFSTGMRQRLAVARALLKRPRVLLMDEPTRSIDPAHAADIWRLVREEVEQVSGCLVLVTHQIQEALSLCSRVAILADGQIVLDTDANHIERFAADLDGFTVSVRGLRREGLEHLRQVHGVCDVQVASQVAGEQVLEVTTGGGADLPLGRFIQEVTGMGATVCSLQRSTPIQGVVERLLSQSNGRAH